MADLTLRFHPAQQAIYRSKARFKVVAAGRRFGKTFFAVQTSLVEALKEQTDTGIPLGVDAEVAYIGVDREQAKRNAWNLFKQIGEPVIAKVHENSAVITLINGVRIRLLGMDDPDAARGMKLRHAVLDEYADMPENVWREIIRPALMDTEGGALFIGTPRGKNHFYKLFLNALTNPEEQDADGETFHPYSTYEAFNFSSSDNPILKAAELQSMVWEYANGSEDLLSQEVEAKFISKGGKIFHTDNFKQSAVEPADGSFYIAVDLAGFVRDSMKASAEIKRLDETAIAIVKVHEGGWWVKEIQHGRWDVRETALRIVKAAKDVQANAVAIEKGALLNAAEPYLNDYQNQFNRWINIVPVTHGNKHKYDRIQWSLQGRAQKGQITLNPGDWVDRFLDQAVDFPDRRSHDDLVDALSYIDQIAENIFIDLDTLPTGFEPLDAVSGY